MAAGFEVDTEVLRRHATRVGQVAADVGTAQSAAGSTDLHGGAFGVLCAFLPLIISGVDGAAREALSAAQAASSGAVGEIGAMAQSFDAVDDRVAERMRGIGKVLFA